MDLSELEQKLLAAGRKSQPSDKVPYSFEKRVMARLTSAHVEDAWAAWGRRLWQEALASVVLCAALSSWSIATAPPLVAETDLSEVYESAVYVAADEIAAT